MTAGILVSHDPPCLQGTRSCEEAESVFMSRYYLFDLPEKLVDSLEPFKLDFELEPEKSESESESDSDSSSESEAEPENAEIKPTNLSYTQYNEETEESMEQWQWANRAHITGTPFVYYTSRAESPLIPDNKVLAMYKSWFSPEALITSPVEEVKKLPKQGKSCVLMVNSGNFAGAIIEHRRHNHKSNISNPLANVVVLESKTFHRYTTRRKQGGSQSASDAAHGKANSAGSTIRRANERALQEEIKQLLISWSAHLTECHRIFYKAPGRSNKQLIAGPGMPIATDDDRLVQIPFATTKPTLIECKNAWFQLTQATVVDPPKPPEQKRAKPPTAKPSTSRQPSKSKSPEPAKSPDEITSSKIVDLIKRSKLPALKAMLQTNNNWDFRLQPESQYRSSPTPLLLAVNLDKPNVVAQLLQWGADPTLKTGTGQTIGEIAKSNIKSYQALQTSRQKLGEAKWDWKSAKVGPPVTKEDILAQETAAKLKLRKEHEEMESQQEKEEHEQRLERLINKHGSGKLVGGLYEASRGLSEADLRQVERERRARAAEARFAKMNRS